MMAQAILARAVVVLVLGSASVAHARELSGRVVGISDGDTLTVLVAGHDQVRVRLWGIDAPETRQDFGSRAKQLASELAFGKTVVVKERDRDRYGRTVADVVLPNGRSLNREMVRAGLAWWYRQYAPADRDLAEMEASARAAKRGLWSQPGAVPPWEWRKKGVSAPVVATGAVIGNRNSHVYHRPDCSSVERMKASNRVEFGSAEQARAAGYRQAGDCR